MKIYMYICKFLDSCNIQDIRLPSGSLKSWYPGSHHAFREYSYCHNFIFIFSEKLQFITLKNYSKCWTCLFSLSFSLLLLVPTLLVLPHGSTTQVSTCLDRKFHNSPKPCISQVFVLDFLKFSSQHKRWNRIEQNRTDRREDGFIVPQWGNCSVPATYTLKMTTLQRGRYCS